MAEDFKFPDVGEGLHEGDIVRWLVKVGDAVQKNQPLVEMETAKAIVEIPSPIEGIVLRLHGKEGDTIKVGSALITFGKPGEKSQEDAKPPNPRPITNNPQPTTSSSPPQPSLSDGFIHATPHTRKLAREVGVDISALKGTGPGGRITDDDVQAAKGKSVMSKASSMTQTSSFAPVKIIVEGDAEHIPLKGLRKAVAEKMARSVHTVAHVTHMDDVDVTDLVTLRKNELKNAEKSNVKLTYLPFIMKAVLAAMRAHPYFNASLDDEKQEIILKKYYHFGFAVDTPEGLIVPVLRDVNKKSILQIAKESQDTAQLARERKVPLDALQGGTFTITNIGSIGGTFATPIVNHPEAAILGVFSIQEKPVVIDTKIVVRSIMPIALSFDHRIIDGGEAARFVNDIKKHLEDPGLLLLDTQ